MCLEEHGAELIEWTCNHCPRKKQSDLNEYTIKMFNIRRLRMAGFPFGKNDLTLEEWDDLGLIEETISGK